MAGRNSLPKQKQTRLGDNPKPGPFDANQDLKLLTKTLPETQQTAQREQASARHQH
jgi:hypothetical protein